MKSDELDTHANGRDVLEQQRNILLDGLRQDIHEACAGAESVEAHATMDEFDVSNELISIQFSVMEMKSDTLVRINEALARMDNGEYGVCESCGARISDARLRAVPFALRCVSCEERRERVEQARQRDNEAWHRLDRD